VVDFVQRRTLAVVPVSVMALFLCPAICSVGAACFVPVLHARLPAHVVDETTNRPAAGVDSTPQPAGNWFDSCNRNRISGDLPNLSLCLAWSDHHLSGDHSAFAGFAAWSVASAGAPALSGAKGLAVAVDGCHAVAGAVRPTGFVAGRRQPA